MIRELETLSQLPPQLRADTERYCSARGYPYGTILNALRDDIWAMGRVHGLIVHLRRKSHSFVQIAKAAGVETDYAIKVFKHACEIETPVKTTNWERIATCRRS